MKSKTLLLLAASLFGSSIQAQEVPNAEEFLPGPPKSTSVEYIKDYLQYEWGKTERETELGKQAKTDFYAQTANYLDAFSKVVGIELSAGNTPNIYTLFDYIMTYGEKAQRQAQASYSYRRPYARFNEPTLIPSEESTYMRVSSYPSSQAMMGWLFAMTMTEICPNKQNEILARGYAYGTSSVISGYHWDSDSYAGCLLASALVARLHSHTGFNTMITSAISEYEKKSGVTNNKRSTISDAYFKLEELPDGSKYLPEPPSNVSAIFATDMSAYIEGVEKRTDKTTDEGQIALNDVDDSATYFLKIFSQVVGKTLSESSTPQLAKLFKTIYPSAEDATKSCKAYYKRLRPYVQLNESTAYTPDEEKLRSNGSYPSGHACAAWLYALVMSEIAPDYQEEILARAFQYGNGRVITGYHWQSDVDMGRLSGAAAYARMHTNHDFLEQLERAQKEFNGTSGIRSANMDETTAPQIYSINGVRLDRKPTRPGIYIEGNKKRIN